MSSSSSKLSAFPHSAFSSALRALFAALLAALAAACAPEPVPADPALWEVTGPDGEHGWLFGTVHSLERPARWRTAEVDRALSRADTVVVEIADLADGSGMADTFARLSRTPGQPPLSRRLRPELRPRLAQVLADTKLSDDGFPDTETWGAALTLAQAGGGDLKAKYGIDRAVIEVAGSRRIVELEGVAGQLAIFDTLPEAEQRDLLAAIVSDAGALETESGGLADAWLAGDMERIERETNRGLLADPELRDALYVKRNEAWKGRIVALLHSGARPFVAVGAAHMAGPEGLPALLEAAGYRVRRVD